MARLAPVPKFRVLDSNGDPLNGGKVYTYITGTTTNKATYTDSTEGTPNANPVILDANGEADIWLLADGEYRFKITDSTDVTLDTVDDVTGVFNPLDSAYSSNDIKFADGNGIRDDSNNETLIFGKATTAVNYGKLSNAATLGSVTFETLGDDTNVSLAINTKAAGTVDITAGTNITGDLDVDNINIDGNTIISTDSAGDINITPDTTGDLVLDGLKFPQADGTAGQLMSTDGAAQLGFTTLPLTGYLGGLGTSNAADTDHDILIAVGSCRDSTDADNIALASALTKQIDASWVAGSAAGGFPTGISLATGTTYHLFLIKDTTNNLVDAGFDTSMTAANLLADATDYTLYRRVASVITDSASNIRNYFQLGDHFTLDVPVQDVGSINPGTARVTSTYTIPLGIKTMVQVTVSYGDATPAADRYLLMSNPDMTDTIPVQELTHLYGDTSANISGVAMYMLSNTSSQLSYRISESQADTTMRIHTVGWIDPRTV